MNRDDVEVGSDGEGQEGEGVGSSRYGTRDGRAWLGEVGQRKTALNVRKISPLGIERSVDDQPSE